MEKIDLNKIKPLLRKNRIKYAAVFGSYSKGKETSDSDVDILVEFEKPIGLFDFVGIEQEISDVLGKKVDLVTETGVSPYIREEIINSAKVFYGQR